MPGQHGERAMHYTDNRNVIGAVQAAATRYPDRRITMFNGRCKPLSDRSYQDFLEAAQRMAAHMAAHGVTPGDRVLVCTHATFRFAVEKLGVEAFGHRKRILLGIDSLSSAGARPLHRRR